MPAHERRQKTVERIRRRATVMKALGRAPRRQARLPVPAQPDNVRLEYFQALRGMLADARALVHRELLPHLPALLEEAGRARADDEEWRADAGPGKRVQALIEGVANSWQARHPKTEFEALSRRYAQATSKHQKGELGKQLKAAIGVDVLGAEPHLLPMLENFAVHNVALITSMSQQYFSQLEERTLDALRTGERAEDLAAELEDRYGVAESRAKLIARDQIGKLNGELNQARQEELGVTRFVWRSLEDNRVRPEHVLLDGKSFDWDTGAPDEGIPGYPINCRCYAEPDLSELLQDGYETED